MNTEPTHKLTVKIGDALRTIQGYTYDEFSALRDELISGLNADLECVQLAKAATNAAPIVGGGTAVAAPAAAPTAPAPPAPAVERSFAHSGRAATSRSDPGRNTAPNARMAPAQPPLSRTAPRNPAKVNSGPGTVCAAA